MSAKDELRDMIGALTPEEIDTILVRLMQINESLLAQGLPQINLCTAKKEHTEAPAATEILADRRRPA